MSTEDRYEASYMNSEREQVRSYVTALLNVLAAGGWDGTMVADEMFRFLIRYIENDDQRYDYLTSENTRDTLQRYRAHIDQLLATI